MSRRAGQPPPLALERKGLCTTCDPARLLWQAEETAWLEVNPYAVPRATSFPRCEHRFAQRALAAQVDSLKLLRHGACPDLSPQHTPAAPQGCGSPETLPFLSAHSPYCQRSHWQASDKFVLGPEHHPRWKETVFACPRCDGCDPDRWEDFREIFGDTWDFIDCPWGCLSRSHVHVHVHVCGV